MDNAEEANEDATELKFPKEFETAKALLNSEVFLLLEQRKNQNEAIDEVTINRCLFTGNSQK